MKQMSHAEEVAVRHGYHMDTDGNLFSKRGLMKGAVEGKGYRFAIVRENGKQFRLRFHRLQAYQKFGDLIYKEGTLVRHLDGNSFNNSYDNIAIGTDSDNQQDIPFLERRSRIKRTKYSDDMALEAYSLRDSGWLHKDIANHFGICVASEQYLITRAKALIDYYANCNNCDKRS